MTCCRPEAMSRCIHKKFCYCRRTAMSVKISSAVETSCTTNPQSSQRVTVDRLAVNSHDWSTVVQVSSTSSTVDNDDEFCWQRDRVAAAKFAKSGVWDKVPGGKYPNFRRYPNFLITQCSERKPSCQKPARFVQSFRYNTGLWQTDRRTHNASIPR